MSTSRAALRRAGRRDHTAGSTTPTMRGTAPRNRVFYRPGPPHRTRQDAIYTANLLLLASRTRPPVPLSRIVGEDAVLDRWSRHTRLWRSQLGEASWTALVAALGLRPARPAASDLHLLHAGGPAAPDPAWRLGLVPFAGPPAAVRATDERPLSERLHAEAAFTWEPDLHRLLHAVAPLLERLPEAFDTYLVREGGRGLSAAQCLIGLLCRPDSRDESAHWFRADLFPLLRALSADERPLAADIVACALRDSATDLPPAVAVALLDGLTSPQITGSGGIGARTWLVLGDCLGLLAARPDISQDRLSPLTRRFRSDAPALDNEGTARTRLLSLLKEAETTFLWGGADRPGTDITLATALTLLDRIPPDQRLSTLILGVLRLGRDLGADDWLAVHSEQLLQRLDSDGLRQLRPTDIDWLRPTVRDRALRAALDDNEAVWRGRNRG